MQFIVYVCFNQTVILGSILRSVVYDEDIDSILSSHTYLSNYDMIFHLILCDIVSWMFRTIFLSFVLLYGYVSLTNCPLQSFPLHIQVTYTYAIKTDVIAPIGARTSAGTVLTVYRKVSKISRILVGNKIVDQSDVVGVSPVGAAPTASSFST